MSVLPSSITYVKLWSEILGQNNCIGQHSQLETKKENLKIIGRISQWIALKSDQNFSDIIQRQKKDKHKYNAPFACLYDYFLRESQRKKKTKL